MVPAVMRALHAKTVMTAALAEEFASDGIDVVAFDPGFVRSDLARNLSLPMRLMMRVAQWFAPTESASGVFASTATELNGVTGVFIDGRHGRRQTPLQFEAAYQARVMATTAQLVDLALAA